MQQGKHAKARTENLDLFSSGMRSLVNSILNRHQQHKRPNIGGTIRWAGGEGGTEQKL